MMSSSDRRNWPAGHEARVQAAGFAWDLVLQIAALRRAHGMSQADLAARLGTQQPNVSRLENPTYDRQNLRTLRAVGDALDAFVDVIYVPRDKLDGYVRHRYLPALEESVRTRRSLQLLPSKPQRLRDARQTSTSPSSAGTPTLVLFPAHEMKVAS